MADVILVRARGRDDGNRALPFGILAIGSYLEKHGFSVDIIDMVREQSNSHDVVRRIAEQRPGIVGISAMTSQSGCAVELSRQIKDSVPCKVVLGGVHFTVLPEEGLGAADAVVVGEGELAMLDFCHNPDTIHGIVKGEQIHDLDDIPFPSEGRLRQLIRSDDVFCIFTSRGCPFNCLFCLGRSQRSSLVRSHSIDSVVDFVELVAQRFGIKAFFIEDDVFVLSKKRVLSFCDEVQKRGLNLKFNCFTHVGKGDLETYRRMKEAGFDEISIGIESGNDDVLKAIKKSQTVAQARETVRLIRKAGLMPYPLFMLGNITETEETIRDTINLASELLSQGGRATFSFAQPYPGSEFLRVAPQYGHLVSTDGTRYWHDMVSFVPHGLTEQKLVELMGEARRLLQKPSKENSWSSMRSRVGKLLGRS